MVGRGGLGIVFLLESRWSGGRGSLKTFSKNIFQHFKYVGRYSFSNVLDYLRFIFNEQIFLPQNLGLIIKLFDPK